MTCLHCHATTTNGLALCELCRRYVSSILEHLPVYFRNLARWRPGRAGSRQVPGSRVLYDGAMHGTGDRISDRLDEAFTALTTWARVLVKDRPGFPRPLTLADAVLSGDLPDEVADTLAVDQPRTVALLCAAFEKHLTTVATLEWAGEFVRDFGQHEDVLRGLTEASVPGWYAGACRRCGVDTHVVPGLTWVTCGGCGATTYARDHLDVVIDEARDWVAPPKRLAEAAVALLDAEMSVPRLYERIKKWGQRDQLDIIRDHEYAVRRHRFGDVLDRLRSEGDTRLDGAVGSRAS